MLDSLAELSNILGLMDLSLFAIILWEFDWFSTSSRSFSVLPKIQTFSDIFKRDPLHEMGWPAEISREISNRFLCFKHHCQISFQMFIKFKGIN